MHGEFRGNFSPNLCNRQSVEMRPRAARRNEEYVKGLLSTPSSKTGDCGLPLLFADTITGAGHGGAWFGRGFGIACALGASYYVD